MDNNVLNIYVCAHKEFDQSIIPDKCHEVLFFNDLHNEKEKMKDFYSEGYHIYDISHKDLKKYKYIGICHYRRFFNDTCENLISYMQEYDCILPERYNIGNMSVYGQYSRHFNGEDIELIGHIIEKHYKEYEDSFYDVMNGNILHVWNMCIMKTEDFKEYVEWVFDILDKFCKIRGFNNIKDVNKYVDENKNKIPNMTNTELDKYFTSNWYCSRIGAHLLERLLNVFVKYKFNKVKEVPVKFIS